MTQENLLPEKDPRVYFSSERTLLSWLRTGIGIMAFGFVVARFGFLMPMFRPELAGKSSQFSIYVGAFLVILGALSILMGTIRYHAFSKTLQPGEIPRSSKTFAPILLCHLITLLGFLLFVQLLM
ncbi:MAG TPA: DUF202 domain-containing protein [Planctomicrobium sp.]|nr:DUF202 domain-containing protein [Planctomicrobium sp.]